MFPKSKFLLPNHGGQSFKDFVKILWTLHFGGGITIIFTREEKKGI